MKIIATVLLVLIGIPMYSQEKNYEITIENRETKISKIVTVDSLDKTKIFLLAKEWIYKNYNSGDAVILTDDKETGRLVCKGNTQTLIYMNSFAKVDGGIFKYHLDVYCKDGKMKVVISDIIHKRGDMVQMRDDSRFADEFPSTWSTMAKKQSAKQWVLMKEQALNEFGYIIQQLTNAVKKGDPESNF